MPQFKSTSFATASLQRHKPMSIEQDAAGLGKYARYGDNPLYYVSCLQYCGGSFYRKVLGYEVLWDAKAEAKLMLCLDYYMTKQEERRVYYTEELRVMKPTKLHGTRWHRGMAPQTLTFDLQWPYQLKEGESVTARVNLLDSPFHVDIERANGDVFTIQYPRYQQFRREHLRRKEKEYERQFNGKRSRTAKTGNAKAEITSLDVARQLIKEDSSRPPFKKMFSMR